MSTDFRALCLELLPHVDWDGDVEGPIVERARAALAAEPAGEGPTPAEIDKLTWQHASDLDDLRIGVAPEDVPALVYAALARWGRLATSPAPEVGEVAELVQRLGWIAAQLGDIGWGDDSASVASAATLLQQLSAPAPAVVAVAEDIQHLVRFMCRTWVAIDEWASMCNEAMETYPMIQGTRNQMNLREIAAQPYDKKRVAIGIQLMLPAHAISMPQAGEGEA
jgi:hypothetical protein